MKAYNGNSFPLGATPDAKGVNFAVYAKDAESVTLLLFKDTHSKSSYASFILKNDDKIDHDIWHIYIEGLKPNSYYAYRVDGPYQPNKGLFFNYNKVLIDPYSKAINKSLWKKEMAINDLDNINHSMRSQVIYNGNHHLNAVKKPKIPLKDLIIYELHVGNFTKSPTSNTEFRGTFSALKEKIPYLKSLGVNAIELMPVFEFDKNNYNNWGYGSIGFFALTSEYCSSINGQEMIDEFRSLVNHLHENDMEIILDIAFGWTGEEDELGPTFCYKGFGAKEYYILDDKSKHVNLSGCKNTLNCNHPFTKRLILDSLEYWSNEMMIDGFRLDQAALMYYSDEDRIGKRSPLLSAIELSEKLRCSKFFVEPWDAKGDYLLGKFSSKYIAWNDKFRDDIRRFVRGDRGLVKTAADRIFGSPDIMEENNGLPSNSLNFIACHDGMTLYDLVSYQQKHNLENGENEKDGLDENYSANYGIEGDTDDEEIKSIRIRQIKNFLTLLFISKGVPMLGMGDEIGRSQFGNNNAYRLDNEKVWFDWSLTKKNQELLEFTKTLIKLRKNISDLLDPDYFIDNKKALVRFHGCSLDAPGFNDPNSRVLSFTIDNSLHMIANMEDTNLCFQLPKDNWKILFDTSDQSANNKILDGKSDLEVRYKSIVILLSSKIKFKD